MFKFLKELFCKHEFIDKCKIDDYSIQQGFEIKKSYQEICSSRIKNNHCRRHDRDNKILYGYCDYYYQKCKKCGKIKEF